MNKNNYCVIMAGGIGSRFWPLTRNAKPKQFLDILGIGKTLLQQTFDRFRTICPIENIFIVTNKNYSDLICEQIPDIKKDNLLLEPLRRNTAPCIAYANYRILKENKDANIIVAPSDHLILNEPEFIRVINQAIEFIQKNDALLTLGIKPNRAETGYGYIQINNTKHEDLRNIGITKVKTFTEKPDIEMAKIFFESGEFFWNSGIFIWSLSSINRAFEKYLTEVDDLFKMGIEKYKTDEEQDYIDKTYSECKNISLDYGIMEKAKNVYVLCADFGWSDLGTWGSLDENGKQDINQNTIIGKNILSYDTQNCIINIPDGKLAVIQGLENYIVVESEDVLLICKKEDEQRIRQFVNDVKVNKGEDFI